MLSASLRMVATSSTVGKAENSSGFWIQSATIRIRTESAIDSASPKSIIIAGTGRKNRQRIRTMPTANATSLPPRLAGGVIAVTDMDVPNCCHAPGRGASPEDCPRNLAPVSTAGRHVGQGAGAVPVGARRVDGIAKGGQQASGPFPLRVFLRYSTEAGTAALRRSSVSPSVGKQDRRRRNRSTSMRRWRNGWPRSFRRCGPFRSAYQCRPERVNLLAGPPEAGFGTRRIPVVE